MKKTDVLAQLRQAMAAKVLVRLGRKLENGHAMGYVVNLSEQWVVLLLVSDDIVYAGFQVFRCRDIVEIEAPHRYADFCEAALRLRKLRRPRTPALDLSSTEALIRTAGAARFALITLHREIADPEVCHIGRMAGVTSRTVDLLEITPGAEWDLTPTPYRLSEITRVDMGGPYEEALALVAASAASRPRQRSRRTEP